MKPNHLLVPPCLALLLAVASCAELEKERQPTVTTDGPHTLEVGQTGTLTATTTNGRDSGYAWASDDDAIAAVDAAGTVSARAAGEAVITATGADTKAVGRHIVVVVTDVNASIPFFDAWHGSAHADASAPAFNEWNDEGAVPAACARCHSSQGLIDYAGGDGSPAGVVDSAAPTGSVVDCKTCHNPAVSALTEVTFPSGATISGLGPEARCMTCHQGRAAGDDVDAVISNAGTVGDDTVDSKLAFTNVHYYPAAATLYAGRAAGGYQYANQVYDVRFRHVPGFDSCVGCHDAHSLEVKVDACSTCHTGATDNAKLRDIRMIASRNQDYDGDGNTTEGIAWEIQGLRERLLETLRAYAAAHGGPLCYGSGSYPYWFADTNGNGACEPSEAVFANAYHQWTPRALKASFNYQLATTDPGNFAHNAKYTIQLLHDSIVDLAGALPTPVDTSALVRNDQGHFDGTSAAARNWDASDGVTATCSRCHGGATGFRFFAQYGVGDVVQEQANGLECYTCHESFAPDYKLFVPAVVRLANGSTTTFDPTPASDPGSDNVDNLCASCHIGRASQATIEAAIAAASPGNVTSFVNVHYAPAAGTRAGARFDIGSEVSGETYAGPLAHPGGSECISCHRPGASNHTFAIADVWEGTCQVCHADASEAADIRPLSRSADYDGDGNVSESLKSELDGAAARLLVAMRDAVSSGAKPCYSDANPYFFKDTNASGPICDSGEAVRSNAFGPWPPALLRAAHNYNLTRKDHGAYAHNFSYVLQLVYDSIGELGQSTGSMTRP